MQRPALSVTTETKQLQSCNYTVAWGAVGVGVGDKLRGIPVCLLGH